MCQSPYWTFTARDVARLEVRGCAIDNRVNHADEHGPLNLAAFNTDGFDVAGRDIYIHHRQVVVAVTMSSGSSGQQVPAHTAWFTHGWVHTTRAIVFTQRVDAVALESVVLKRPETP